MSALKLNPKTLRDLPTIRERLEAVRDQLAKAHDSIVDAHIFTTVPMAHDDFDVLLENPELQTLFAGIRERLDACDLTEVIRRIFQSIDELLNPQVNAFDLRLEYALDADRRVAKRHATLRHMAEILATAESRLIHAKIDVANKRREFELLRPHWREGMTKTQAVDAYLAAHAADTNDV